MADETIKQETIACPSCGGDLGKSARTEGSGEDAEEVPIARCLSCGKEYDRRTDVYYRVYELMFAPDAGTSPFKLGAKGMLGGVEYEIIGRIRYQDEDEYELDVWDEWLAVSAEGGYVWFVEEEGRVFSYSEYTPESIDLEASGKNFEFEGRHYSKEDTGFVARIVFAEGELSWRPEIGEPAQCYDFSRGHYRYTIEQSEDEVSVTRGTGVPYRDVILAFSRDEFYEKYQNTLKRRKRYVWKALVYIAMMLAAFSLTVARCVSGSEVADAIDYSKTVVIADNELRTEDNASVYVSQVLYNPIHLRAKPGSMYTIRVFIDQSVQPLNREWQSFRMMLIRHDKLQEFLRALPAKREQSGPGGSAPVKPGEPALSAGLPADSPLREVLDDIDLQPEPVESLAVSGDFWDEEGYDDEGHWHEAETAIEKDFVIDATGDYHVYLELYSQNARSVESVRLAVVDDVKSYRYFLIAFFIFMVLWIVNQVRAKSYNELPFDVAVK